MYRGPSVRFPEQIVSKLDGPIARVQCQTCPYVHWNLRVQALDEHGRPNAHRLGVSSQNSYPPDTPLSELTQHAMVPSPELPDQTCHRPAIILETLQG